MTQLIDPKAKQAYAKPEILTATGKMVNPFDLKVEDISPIDIAISHGNTCRYTGHTDPFYSVAEHCCLLHDYALNAGCSNGLLKTILLHDGNEPYLVDLAAPIKHGMNGFGDKFKEVADAISMVVAERFGLITPEPAMVKEIDLRIRETEMKALFPPDAPRRHYDDPLPVTIQGWDPYHARWEFLSRLADHDIIENRSGGWEVK